MEPAFKLYYLEEVFQMRNKIVHEYDIVDVTVLYSFITDELPAFVEQPEAELAIL